MRMRLIIIISCAHTRIHHNNSKCTRWLYCAYPTTGSILRYYCDNTIIILVITIDAVVTASRIDRMHSQHQYNLTEAALHSDSIILSFITKVNFLEQRCANGQCSAVGCRCDRSRDGGATSSSRAVRPHLPAYGEKTDECLRVQRADKGMWSITVYGRLQLVDRDTLLHFPAFFFSENK